jgi:hypothetical protein
VEIYIIVIRLS